MWLLADNIALASLLPVGASALGIICLCLSRVVLTATARSKQQLKRRIGLALVSIEASETLSLLESRAGPAQVSFEDRRAQQLFAATRPK